MENKTKRPVSVWITQILLAVGILLAPIFLIRQLFELFSCFLTNGLQQCLTLDRTINLIGGCLLFILVLLAFWGLQKRKQYGKWLGLLFLVLMMMAAITGSSYFQLIYRAIASGQALPAPPYDCWEKSAIAIEQEYCGYSSYLDLVLRSTLDILVPPGILGFLAIRLSSHA
jgi:hypothetical protein